MILSINLSGAPGFDDIKNLTDINSGADERDVISDKVYEYLGFIRLACLQSF